MEINSLVHVQTYLRSAHETKDTPRRIKNGSIKWDIIEYCLIPLHYYRIKWFSLSFKSMRTAHLTASLNVSEIYSKFEITWGMGILTR